MDEATQEVVRDWLTRASHDLRAARVLAAQEELLLDAAIYHCQQAGEKAVKAWLQAHDAAFPKVSRETEGLESSISRSTAARRGLRTLPA